MIRMEDPDHRKNVKVSQLQQLPLPLLDYDSASTATEPNVGQTPLVCTAAGNLDVKGYGTAHCTGLSAIHWSHTVRFT
jgi:hypothetical protein